MNPAQAQSLSSDDVQLLRYVAAVLDAGLPLVAMLQLVRVYGQAMAQVADAEVRLFHLYVHEPLMRSGATGIEMADEMLALTRELLPLASPVMDQVHQRYLQHFVEQDVVGHMEADLDGSAADLGRLRVAIAFADLAGYTRLTEEEGELEAVDAVERFVDAVQSTLPDDARVIKTIGDEVMIVGSDPAGLTDWGVGFQQLQSEPPLPRIGIHYGEALYRDGDYYGRDVNIASRVAARSGRRRGAGDPPDRRAGRVAPRVRADRRRPAEGLHRVDRDLHRQAAAGGASANQDAMRGPGRKNAHARARGRAARCGSARGRAALGRAGLDVPARPRGPHRGPGRGHGAARQLRAARLGRRG